RLVRERGRLMKEAGEQNPGAMAAILGLDVDVVTDICEQSSAETSGNVIVANDNCPGQLVISGNDDAIAVALEKAQQAGAKRAIRLAVSIASHSPLMEPAAAAFREFLAEINFRTPQIPIYANISAMTLPDVESIRHELATQLTQPVRWTESVRAMIAAGANHFIEVGPKDVLTGLVKRIDRSVQRSNLNTSLALREISGQSIEK
ncbi:MAG: ACP S-malonyltransferase, partial [Anaerolineae bacterium]|nr:ACP S-malonyltransferase [Anaerolineae bacterium]